MKNFLFGALAALLLSSCTASESSMMASSSMAAAAANESVQVGTSAGLVWPTDKTGCIVVTPEMRAKMDPPLPKNAPPHATWYNTGSPPYRYQGDVKVTIYFEQPNKINRDGQGGQVGCTGAVFAYSLQDKNTIHLPNPCTYPASDAYARLACHEMAHINGWPGYHGD